MAINRTNVGRQMVGDLGNFVGRDLGKQFMSKPQKLAEGDSVAEEIAFETVSFTDDITGETKTFKYNPETHHPPDSSGRMRKKGVNVSDVALQGGTTFFDTAELVEEAAAPAGPAAPKKEKRPIPINPETDADEAARQEDRDQMFNPITGIGKQIPVEDIHRRNQMYQTVGPLFAARAGIPFQARGPLEQWLTTGDSKYVGNYSGVPATRSDGSIDLSQPYPSRIMDNRREGLGLPDEIAKSELDYALRGGKDPEDLTKADIKDLKVASEMSLADRESGQSAKEQIRAADVSKRGDTLSPQEAADIERERKDLGLIPNTRTWTKTPSNFDLMNRKTWTVPRAFDDISGTWNRPLDEPDPDTKAPPSVAEKLVTKDPIQLTRKNLDEQAPVTGVKPLSEKRKEEEAEAKKEAALKKSLEEINAQFGKKPKPDSGLAKALKALEKSANLLSIAQKRSDTGEGSLTKEQERDYQTSKDLLFPSMSEKSPEAYETEYSVSKYMPTRDQLNAYEAFFAPDDRIDWSEDADSPVDTGSPFRKGGPVRYANGGGLSSMQPPIDSGDFVIASDVVSGIGDGSSDFGVQRLTEELGVHPRPFSAALGGEVRGPGSGLDDLIQTSVRGKQAARLANQEFVVPRQDVMKIGKGSLKNGQEMLYALMDRVRKQKTGGQQPPRLQGSLAALMGNMRS